MNSTSQEILARLLVATGSKNEAGMAAALGISSQAVYSAKNKGKIPPAWIFLAAERFGVSADWIYFGDRNSIKGRETDPEVVFVPLVEPYLTRENQFQDININDLPQRPFNREFLKSKGNLESMVMIRISGNSMSPEILNNDTVVVDQSMKRIVPGGLYAVEFERTIYIKRIDMLPGKVVMKCVNPAFPALEFSTDTDGKPAFNIIGRVIWCSRDYV